MSLNEFFRYYAELSTGDRPEALAALYAPTFIVGGPQGSQAFANDDRFLEWLREVAAFNRRYGLRTMTPVHAHRTTLSPLHSLANVTWGACFEKTGDRLIEFEIAYLIEQTRDDWRILAYVSRSDQMTAMKDAGLF